MELLQIVPESIAIYKYTRINFNTNFIKVYITSSFIVTELNKKVKQLTNMLTTITSIITTTFTTPNKAFKFFAKFSSNFELKKLGVSLCAVS